MACICAVSKDYALSLEHVENAIIKNGRNYKALNLKAWLLDKTGKKDEAKKFAASILKYDTLDYSAMLFLGHECKMNDNTAIEIAIEHAYYGDYENAVKILKNQNSNYPLIHYYLAFYDRSNAKTHLEKARRLKADGCFPHRLSDMLCLEYAINADENNGMDNYYLGNLFYDYRRYDEAIHCFEICTEKNPDFPTAYRNLSLLYYNKKHDAEKAVKAMETAFYLDEADMRVLLELDLLYKNTGVFPENRLAFLEKYKENLSFRDDLYLEYITLLNITGKYNSAYKKLMEHNFHPWEGGEGKVPAQYIACLVQAAKDEIAAENYKKAIKLLEKALTYPHNLGEGKLYGAQENLQYYMLGIAYEEIQDEKKSHECFKKAATGLSEPKSAIYYNDQPPETIFCQGLALLKLHEIQKAEKRFNSLIDYCENHFNDNMKIDYFAVSLPDFLVLDADLNKQNKIHCLFMKGLGLLGLKKEAQAKACFENALKINPAHFALNIYKKLFIS